MLPTNIKIAEIIEGLDLLWRNNIKPSKVVLGLAFYGRSFTLSDSSCNTPGCAFSGGGTAGPCTGTSGILSNAEIQDVISKYDLTPTLDKDAAVKYMTWDSDQWLVFF
jgi:chitinase